MRSWDATDKTECKYFELYRSPTAMATVHVLNYQQLGGISELFNELRWNMLRMRFGLRAIDLEGARKD